MGGILLPHHQICPNPSPKTAFPGLYALHKDGVLFCAPRQGFLCSSLATIKSAANGSPSPGTVKKYIKEEFIAFFRSIQTSIAENSPKTSKMTSRKQSPDPFEEVDRRKQTYGSISEEHQDGQPQVLNLDDMKVAELRELARARQMKGYSKLKKRELIDRLKGV